MLWTKWKLSQSQEPDMKSERIFAPEQRLLKIIQSEEHGIPGEWTTDFTENLLTKRHKSENALVISQLYSSYLRTTYISWWPSCQHDYKLCDIMPCFHAARNLQKLKLKHPLTLGRRIFILFFSPLNHSHKQFKTYLQKAIKNRATCTLSNKTYHPAIMRGIDFTPNQTWSKVFYSILF